MNITGNITGNITKNIFESIVGTHMKVVLKNTRKALNAILIATILGLGLSFSTAQEASTLTPVQTETELNAQETTTSEQTEANQSQNSAVITTVVTTPTTDTATKSTESGVCDALANQIVSNLANYPDWQLSLNDANGNVQGLGEMEAGSLTLQLFNASAKELYLYFFTDAEAISIANRSGLRISLFDRDSSVASNDTSYGSRGIIINATIGEDREALPINDCILPFEQVFPNYTIK